MHAIAVLGYSPKLKTGLGLAFREHFLHDFSNNNVPYLMFFLWTKFQCHTVIPSQDIKQNVLLSSYLNNW